MKEEQDDPLALFQRYFSIRPALSNADREETYRIRFRVYCEEFGYEPAERFPTYMETDEFDDIATHCLITHVATGMAAGCVRVCPATLNGNDHPLPLNKCCERSLDPVAMANYTAPRARACEASRFAVDGAFRRRSGEALTRFGRIVALNASEKERRTFPLLSIALLFACTSVADILGRPYMFAVMEPFLPRLLRRSGIVFHRMGRDLDYHGIRAVYVADTREFAVDIDSNLRGLYGWIHEQLLEPSGSRSP